MARHSSLRGGRVGGDKNSLPTYFATGTGYTAYATPTDLFTISGVDDRVVRVLNMRLLVQTTSGALQTVHWIKRSTANSDGTATQPTGWALDGADNATHGAVINLYTAAPTTGTVVGRFYNAVLTTATTAVPGVFTASQVVTSNTSQSYRGIVLRSSAESFCCNWNGAALPAGFTATWEVLWTESSS